MPKPKKVDRPVNKKIAIPESITLLVDLELYSELEGRVPHGAWGELVTRLLGSWLVRQGDNHAG